MTAITWKALKNAGIATAGVTSLDFVIQTDAVWAPLGLSFRPQTLTPVSWVSGISNTWDKAAAWSTGKVPNAFSAASISVAGTYTVTISGTDVANSLAIGQQAATALVTGSLGITTNLTVSAGTLALGGNGDITGGTVTLAAGSNLISTGVVTTIASVFNDSGSVAISSGVVDLTGSGSLAGTLASGAGTLVLDGAKFTTVAGSLTGSGNLEIASGTLAVSGASGTLAAALSVNAGTLSVAGGTNLTLTGAVTLGSPAADYDGGAGISGPGTLTTTGTTTIAAYNTVNNVPELYLGGQITWVNTGTVNDAGLVYLNPNGGDTVAIVNQAGAVFNLIGGTADLQQYNGGTDTFTNAGTLTSSSGTAVSAIYATTTSSGVISVGSGTLDFQNGLTSSGSISLATESTPELDNGGTLTGALSGSGTLLVTGGNTSLSEATSGLAALTVTGGGGVTIGALGLLSSATALSISDGGTLTVAGASGTLAAALSVNAGTLSVAGGTNLTLSGPVTLGSPAADYDGGGAGITGPGTLTTTGTTTIAAYNTVNNVPELYLGGQITWVNTGTVNDAGLVYLNPNGGDTVAIVNQAGAVFNLIGGTADLQQYNGGTDTFTNAGTLTSSSGTAVSAIYATTTSSGVISVGSGTLDFQNGLTSSGSISLATGSTLELDNGGTLTGALSGSGTLLVTGGNTSLSEATSGLAALTVTGGGGVTIGALGLLSSATALSISDGGTLTVAGASGTLAAALSVNAGTLSVAGGTNLTLSGPVTLGSPAADYDGGGAGITGPGTLTTTGTTTIAAYNTVNNVPELYLGGQITWVNTGTVNDAGLVYLNPNGGDTVAIVNQAGASFNLTGGTADLAQYNNGTDTFTNAGTLSKTGGGTSQINMDVVNTGLITAKAGTLVFAGADGSSLAGTVGSSGTGLVLVESNITAGGSLSILDNGTLTSLQLSAVTLTNSGTIADAGKLAFGFGTGGTTSLVNQASAVFDLTSNDAQILNSGTTSTITITNAGLIAKTGGTGLSTIAGPIVNSGTIESAVGTLRLAGSSLTGTGALKIDASATLDLAAAPAATQAISFTGGAGATLKLEHDVSIKNLGGFGAGDRLDMPAAPSRQPRCPAPRSP